MNISREVVLYSSATQSTVYELVLGLPSLVFHKWGRSMISYSVHPGLLSSEETIHTISQLFFFWYVLIKNYDCGFTNIWTCFCCYIGMLLSGLFRATAAHFQSWKVSWKCYLHHMTARKSMSATNLQANSFYSLSEVNFFNRSYFLLLFKPFSFYLMLIV